MNQSHYPSLELCKKLTEIWFPKSTVNSWCDFGNISWSIEITDVATSSSRRRDKMIAICPSIAELLDEFPHEIITELPVFLSIDKHSYWWYVSYTDNWLLKWSKGIKNKSLPDALVEMILWLHENRYIKFKTPA